MSDSEGIVYAEIDTASSVEPKQFHDAAGYYNRFDIFDLRIDRSAREPARFVQNPDRNQLFARDREVVCEPAAVVSIRDGAGGR